MGLFPCSPVAPTLAVDICVLNFARELFLRLPPNVTGFSDTLETVLSYRSYKLETRVWCFNLVGFLTLTYPAEYTSTTIWNGPSMVYRLGERSRFLHSQSHPRVQVAPPIDFSRLWRGRRPGGP